MAKIQFGLKSADAIQQNFKIIFDRLVRGYRSIMGKNPEGLDLIKIRFEAAEKARDSAKVVDRGGMTLDPSKPIMGGTQESAALKSGIMKATGEGPKEITEDTGAGFIDFVRQTDPEGAAKLQKEEDRIRAMIEAANKRASKNLKNKKKKLDDPEEKAMGGRIGYKLGSIDKARRAFLKTAAGIGGGIAALKTGLLGLSKKAPEAVEKVTENFSTTLSEAPDYFFSLVSKIKSLGKQSKIGPAERVNEYSYVGKNGDQYTLTEDITTGDAQIIKDKMGVGTYGDKTFDTINDRTVMEYKAPKKDVDPDTQKFIDEGAEYEEYKVDFDPDGTPGGADAIDKSVQKEIIEEATDEAPSIKKAGGGLAYMLGE
jgi:hypothetical protein